MERIYLIAIGDLLWLQEISYGHRKSPMAIGDVLYGSVPSPCKSGGPEGEAPRVSRGSLGGGAGPPNSGPSFQRGGLEPEVLGGDWR